MKRIERWVRIVFGLNCCSWLRIEKDWKSFRMHLGFIRIEKEWKFFPISVEFIRFGIRFNWIHSDWTSKRPPDWKGFRRIKKSVCIIPGSIRIIEAWIETCVRIYSDWIWSWRTNWKNQKGLKTCFGLVRINLVWFGNRFQNNSEKFGFVQNKLKSETCVWTDPVNLKSSEPCICP